ncbi:TIGR02253 family HAD-type hydrolase [Bacillus carboniphilus]|uniref:TIGR02253 family HAD-type hydrolase n=1 Tax=Bacillus carboniphilus TaxID=86663 RepID=A0ABN0WA21_9BACI
MEKWITFDLDGTLMQNPFVEWVFPEIESTVLEKAGGELQVKDALVAEHNRRMKENLITEAYDWDDILKQFLQESDIDLQIDIEELVIKHSIHPKVYLLENEIIDTLLKIKGKGYQLAVATNGYYKYQFPVLETLQLSGLFDLTITPEEVGYAKPDVRMIQSLSNKGKILAHVGDRIDHDVNIANQLGIPSVLIMRRLPEEYTKLTPIERAKHPGCIDLCRQKWEKETRNEFGPFTSELVPTYIIHSITELETCLTK